MAKSFSRNNS